MASQHRTTRQIENCDQEATDAERMAALVSAWWDAIIQDRQVVAGEIPLTTDEFEVMCFAVRDLAARTHRVAEMIDQLPR